MRTAHLGGLARLKEMSGATIYSHAWEADIIAGDRKQQLPSAFGFQPLETWPIIALGYLLGPLAMHKPCPVDQVVSDGDRVGPLRVVYTPGHTPGHLAFYWLEKRVLFSGDAFVTWPSLCPGWKNSNLNAKQCWETLGAMSELDSAVLGVGHGKPVTQDGASVMRELAQRRPNH